MKLNCIFFQELIKDLQTAKRQTWEERERLSEHYDEERRITLANKVNQLHFCTEELKFSLSMNYWNWTVSFFFFRLFCFLFVFFLCVCVCVWPRLQQQAREQCNGFSWALYVNNILYSCEIRAVLPYTIDAVCLLFSGNFGLGNG